MHPQGPKMISFFFPPQELSEGFHLIANFMINLLSDLLITVSSIFFDPHLVRQLVPLLRRSVQRVILLSAGAIGSPQ